MTRTAKKLHGLPVVEGPQLHNGVPSTCVVVANSKPFARACVDLMRRRDGKDHGWKLGIKAFWVPNDLIDEARAVVEAKGERWEP